MITMSATAAAGSLSASALAATESSPAAAAPATAPSAAAIPNNASEVDYGQLYVLQKREAPRPWEINLNYSYGFSNPHLGTHGISMGFQRQIGNFVLVGISPTIYANSTTDLGQQLETQLDAQGIQEQVDRPRFSLMGGIGVIPFAGMLNWFNSTAVNFDLVIGLSAGATRYSIEDHMLPTIKTSISPRFMITERIGVTAALNISFDRFDAPNKWVHRVDTSIGTVFRF